MGLNKIELIIWLITLIWLGSFPTSITLLVFVGLHTPLYLVLKGKSGIGPPD